MIATTAPAPIKLSDLDPDAFYTPEEIAPIIGLKATELRRYCRESGHCTRLGRQKITLDVTNAKDLIAWVKAKNSAPVVIATGTINYFA